MVRELFDNRLDHGDGVQFFGIDVAAIVVVILSFVESQVDTPKQVRSLPANVCDGGMNIVYDRIAEREVQFFFEVTFSDTKRNGVVKFVI